MRLLAIIVLTLCSACSEQAAPPAPGTPGQPGDPRAPAPVAADADPLARAVGELSSDVATVRGAALHELVEAGAEAVPHLLRMADADQRTLANAPTALAAIGAPAVPALRAALGSDDARQRLIAVMALLRMGPEAADAAPELMRAQKDPDLRVRALAERAYRAAIGDGTVRDAERRLRDQAERRAR